MLQLVLNMAIKAAEKPQSKKRFTFFACLLGCSVLLIFSIVREDVFRYFIEYPIGITLSFLVPYVEHMNYKTVEHEFKQMPGIQLISLDIDSDSIINASLQVAGKGVIHFVDVRETSFHSSPNLFLSRIGPWRIIGWCYKQNTIVGTAGFNIGIQGKEAAFFPFQMHNIRDIINHYDDILTILQTWPKNIGDPRVPGVHNTIIEGNQECYYFLQDAPPVSGAID